MQLPLPSLRFPAKNSVPLALLLLTLNAPPVAALTLHVNHNATGSADGSSWTDAFPDLQSALAEANHGDDIWVATGTYYPDQGPGQTENKRTSTFMLLNGVRLLGGFSGSEVLLSQRNPAAFPTILSGDLLQNDATSGSRLDNAYHVINGSGTDSTAVLDGFSITSGNANGNAPDNGGGGIICNGTSSPTIINCSFLANLAADLGAAVYNNDFSTPTFTNCSFIGNETSFFGGAVCNTASSTPTFTNCTFTENAATGLMGYGGAIYNSPSSPATITNSILWNNSATSSGNQLNGPLTPASSNNLVQGVSIGAHVIANTDPLFNIDPSPGADGLWRTPQDNNYGDLRLQASSPARDAGLNSTNNSALDLAFLSRLQNGVIDLGAFEIPLILTVTTTTDSGPGSLRDLIATIGAPGGATILFDPSLTDQLITLSSGALLVDKTLVINGSTLPAGITVDANQTSRVFEVTADSVVTFDSFTITGGKTPDGSPGLPGDNSPGGTGNDGQDGTPGDDGGGIHNAGTLTLIGMTIANNRTGDGGDAGSGGSGTPPGNGGHGARSGHGGGIYNTGTLHIINCTIDHNETGQGGDAGSGSGLPLAGPGGAGAGIYNAGTLLIQHGTITSNSVGPTGSGAAPTTNSGGGIKQLGQLTLQNSIVALNSAPLAGTDLDGLADQVSGINFVGDPTGASGLGPNLLSGEPLLGPLVSNGGPTKTRRPSFDSPVVDPVNGDTTSLLSTDQRHLDRIVSGIVDIGSVEALLSKVVTTTADSGPDSLRHAVSSVQDGGVITFAPTLDGGTIILTTGELVIPKSLTIDASSLPQGLTIDANGSSRVMTIDDGDDLIFQAIQLQNLTIAGGNTADHGGGIANRENLTLLACTIGPNVADGHGGGLWYPLGSSLIQDCSFDSNSAAGSGGGGGIRVEAGASLEMLDSSFRSNNSSNTSKSSLGGGALGILSSSVTIADCSFSGNTAEYGGAVQIASASPTLLRCEFTGNQSARTGGALSITTLSNPTIGNCLFLGNASDFGGAASQSDSSPLFLNCAFIGNHATDSGGAAYNNNSSSPTLVNCSLAANHADNDGGGMQNKSSTAILTHCILWGNTADGSDPQISGSVSGTSNSNLIQNGSGTHVILTGNPSFVRDPDPGPDGIWSGLSDNDYGNLLLVADSPALEAGSNAAYDAASAITTDLSGNPRKVGIIDLGAYEGAYQNFAYLFPLLDRNADENSNGRSNFVDYGLGLDPTAPVTVGTLPAYSNDQIISSYRAHPAADTIPVYQSSSDLVNWQDMIEGEDYEVISATPLGNQVQVTLRLLPPALGPANNYFRQRFLGADD